MNIYMVSAFRNAARYVERAVMQAAVLSLKLSAEGHRLHCIWGEGDSTDDTRDQLAFACYGSGIRVKLVDVTHGGPEFGSVVDAQRFKQLAYVGNKLWAEIPASADAVVWVESDLIWDASTLVRLVESLERVPMVAPMILRRRPGGLPLFYDTWAARKDGDHFRGRSPYHPALKRSHAELVEMDSVGSCVAMRKGVSEGLEWPEEDVIVGLCRQWRERGGSVWLHTGLAVWHE